MKFAAFACLASLIGASAFVAPAPKQTRSRGMARMAVDDLIGRNECDEEERKEEKKESET